MASVRGLAMAAAALAAGAHADCSNARWAVAYCPERCSVQEGAAIVSCLSPRGEDCGTRMSSAFKVGAGWHSMSIKAAPGPGVATTFYLSNNGGLYDKTKTTPWVELDFELMGNQAGSSTSRIWTNMFTGVAVEHWRMITVPFDTSAGYHDYAFKATDTSVEWVVDGVTYRREDIAMYQDVVESVRTSALQEFLSVWGKSSADEGEGIPEFREALGLLDQNTNPFPLIAGYKPWSAA